MSRKISLGAALALALLLVAASIPLTMLYAQNTQNKLIQDLPARMKEYGAMDEIRGLVDKNFYQNVNSDNVSASSVRGYIAGLDDTQSHYLDAKEYSDYTQRLQGQRPETGLELEYALPAAELPAEDTAAVEDKNGSIVVSNVKDGSPAAASGLQAGDIILEAKNADEVVFSAKNLTPANAAEMLAKLHDIELSSASRPSVSVTYTVRRGKDQPPPMNVMIGSSVSSVSSAMMSADAETGTAANAAANVGYIKIYYFIKSTAEDLEKAVMELNHKGASYYVIDLRGCTEGTVEYACKALNLFFPILTGSDVMATITYNENTRQPKPYPTDATNIFSYAAPMALLINGSTTGAAELFAYDMKAYYYDAAHPESSSVILVGNQTAGIHTEQEVFPLAQVGGAALLTVGKVYPYRVKEGVDWLVEPTLRIGNEELILRKAIEALTQPKTNSQTAENM